MMPYDGGDLYIKVDLYINGSWVEVTSRARGGRAAGGVDITRGRSTGAIQAESSRLDITIGNADGYLTEGNPESPWYPFVGRGCRIRVSVSGVLASDSVRFDGEIDTMVAVYPGGSDSSMRIIATGSLGGQLGLGSDALRSPLYRSMSGIGPSDYVPAEYWPLEDGSDSTRFASAVSGGLPGSFAGPISLASDSTLTGSSALPSFDPFSVAVLPVRAYATTTQWVVQLAVKVDAEPTAAFTFAEIETSGTAKTWRLVVTPGATASVGIEYYDSTGTLISGVGIPLDGIGGHPTEAEFFGSWAMYTIASTVASATTYQTGFGMTVEATFDPVGGTTETGSHGAITAVRLYGATGASYGHVGVWTDPAFDWIISDASSNSAAMFGFAGELPTDRLQRLGREEGITVSVTGTSTQTMGPQPAATLADLFLECEAVDGGLLSDGADGGGITYRSLSSIRNQAASLAVTTGALDVEVAPIWDNRNIRNDVTVSRSGGSSSRQTDEAHVARTRRRIKDSATVNTETDAQLPDQAGWRVNTGTSAAPRYNGVGINLRNPDGATLADTVLALEAGDRFTAAEATLPSQHPPGGIDALVIGWAEHLDAVEWTFAPNCVDYAPFRVAVLDDDDYGKLDTAGCLMQAPTTTTGTTLTVATTVLPKWTTDPTEMPIPITVAGQVNSVTAISNVSPSFVAAGTVAHGNNASVAPSLPAGAQAGDLLLVWAAIRNSGTGTVDTPAGYTLLLQSGNVALLAKLHTGTESAPTVTFTGGVANADTSAQMAAFRGVGVTVHASASQLNGSAQNIAYPALDISRPNCLVLYLGWKQDDWTSVATIAGATEIGEPSTTSGADQGIVWDYVQQTTAAAIAAGSFTVTGGAAAISRGAVIALATDVQTMTAIRGTNGVSKALAVGDQVNVFRPARLAL
jgi:hypothetical protein